MPLIEAHFKNDDGSSNFELLGTFGPTTQVFVCPPVVEGQNPNEVKGKMVPALIDTGAQASMIDDDLAKELGLAAIDKATILGVGGAKDDHSVYMANIIATQLDSHGFGRFVGAKLKEGGQYHEVLLGRDFLSQVVMIYDGIRAQVTIASPKRTS